MQTLVQVKKKNIETKKEQYAHKFWMQHAEGLLVSAACDGANVVLRFSKIRSVNWLYPTCV